MDKFQMFQNYFFVLKSLKKNISCVKAIQTFIFGVFFMNITLVLL